MENTTIMSGSEFSQFYANFKNREAFRATLSGNCAQSREYKRKLAETAELVAGVQRGKIPFYELREAMSTSDFAYLFSDIIGTQLLGNYQMYPADWKAYAREGTVPDFRTVNRKYMDGATGLMSSVAEGEDVPYDNNIGDGEYTYTVAKYEKAYNLSFEALVNDNLDAFTRLPEDLAASARNTENWFATSLYVDSSGPHASLYTAGNANIVHTDNGASADNPALSIAGLQDAYTVLRSQTDARGMPIFVDMATLVVPPALEITARNIVNSTSLELTTAGGAPENITTGVGGQRLVANNWMRNKLQIVVNPWIPYIATTNGNTSWFLFANPQTSRPALELGFIPQFRNPLILRRKSDVEFVSGGDAPNIGTFNNMTHQWKVVHIFGGAAMDGKSTVASNGSGS